MGYFTDTDFDNTLDMIDSINEVIERNIRNNFIRVPASDLGLDDRSGRVYVDVASEVVAVECSRSIDYYGGFEYIKEGEGRTTFGDYTFYTTESSRVQDCFDTLRESVEVDAE